MSRATSAVRVLVWSLAAVVLFVGIATLRAVLDGERELRQSDAAFDANELHGAIEHARRAASAYAPGAPHVERGYERLLAIARGAEASGRPELAMLAYQAERAAVLESASVIQPFPARLEEANRNLARLAAAKSAAEPEQTETAQRLFRAAQGKAGDRAPFGAVLAGGLLLSALGLSWFGLSALRPGGRIEWLRGRWGLLVFLAGIGLWAFAALHG